MLYFYEDGIKVGVTSRAFDVIEDKELMRGWNLTFKVANKNPMRKYIKPGAVFEIDGQLFDIYSFHQNSGASNITDVTANHVSYRLNEYALPPGYSFVGTSAQILADILTVAKNADNESANTIFEVGTCANVGIKSFNLNNEDEVSARSATLALQAIGVEVNYDNFKIHLPQRVGSETGHTFKFGADLVSLDRTWSIDDGASYEISIASLGQFALGDTVQVEDSVIGDTVSRRIVKYTKCHDDPSKDTVTLGVFIRDSATNAIAMQIAINDAQSTADNALEQAQNSVQIGTSYNNVDISHTFGFRSTSGDGLMRTLQNGTDGFVIQRFYSGNWVTIWQANSATGRTVAYNLDHSQKVELGGTYGFTTWVSSNGGSTWTQTGGMGADGSVAAGRLTGQNATTSARIGKDDNGVDLFALFDTASVTPNKPTFAMQNLESGTPGAVITSDAYGEYWLRANDQSGNTFAEILLSSDGIDINTYGTDDYTIRLGPSEIRLLKNGQPYGKDGYPITGYKATYTSGICTDFIPE